MKGDGVITMNDRFGGHAASLRDALAGGLLPQIAEAAANAKPDHKLSDIKFLPVITNPERIACAGINYRSHAERDRPRDAEAAQSMFLRLTDTLVGHEGEMIRPTISTQFDFEGELAVVIGKGGRHIPMERALDHVAGYTCFVDGSVRDYQKFSVTSGKNFPGTGPLGPWMVTTDEIPDPTKLTLMTRLNGQEMQRSGTDLLIYSIPHIVGVLLGLHHAGARRRDRDRHAGGRRPPPQSAGLDEGRRRAGGGDHRDRRAADADRG